MQKGILIGIGGHWGDYPDVLLTPDACKRLSDLEAQRMIDNIKAERAERRELKRGAK